MFTGLVSDMGVVERIAPQQGGVRLTLAPRALKVDDLALGESVACSGVCLTVVERGGGRLDVLAALRRMLARRELHRRKKDRNVRALIGHVNLPL